MRRHHFRDEINKKEPFVCSFMLYSLYIRQKKKWVKIGEFCPIHGVMLDTRKMEEIFKNSILSTETSYLVPLSSSTD